MVFISLFFFLSLSALLDIYFNRNSFVYLSVIVLAFVAGLRSLGTGFDTYNYYYDYINVLNGLSPNNSKEIGFVLIEKALAAFNAPTWVLFTFIAFFTLIILAYGYSKLSCYSGLAILYYYSRFYISRDLNQIRASLAAAILLCSLNYIIKHSFWKFTLVVVIASLIHSAAVIGILLYPAYLICTKVKKSKIVTLYIVILIVSGFMSYKISPLIESLNINRLDAYTTSNFYTIGSGLQNPVIWLQVVISIVALLLYENEKNILNEKYNVVLITYMISTILLILFSQYYTLAGRMSTFFATVEPIVLLNILQRLKINKGLSKYVFIAIALVVFFVINYSTGLISKINYSFIL
ncbi:EpsG family protein [Limosilactobacillus reuteri]|uniref:EpsG family protein n=1 Tax=Limosilactobacillus reuteri TaxID=1598 RepID=UPI002AAAD6DC|nr:EpsG family protein [Limosilactobacillus reuteri]WPU44141.1 EpsG family protein [Limosilactobacillus reuteri]